MKLLYIQYIFFFSKGPSDPREGEAIDPKVFTDSSARQETPCEDYTKEAGTYPKIQLTGMNFKHINQIKMQWILCDFKGLGFNLQYMRNALLGWTWTFSRSEREREKKKSCSVEDSLITLKNPLSGFFSQWAIVFSFPKFTRREAGVVVFFSLIHCVREHN